MKSPKHTESENTLKSAKKTHKQGFGIEKEETITNEQIIEVIPIKNTPFNAIKEKDKWFITLGKYRLTEEQESLKACKKAIKKNQWSIIMQLTLIMMKENKIEELI